MEIKAEVFTIKAPATTANLGPGFDSLGLALAQHNSWTVEVIKSSGPSECRVTKSSGPADDGFASSKEHLFFASWTKLHQLGLGPDVFRLLEESGHSVHLQAVNNIPTARGLGSSAAVRVASALAFKRICKLKAIKPWQLAASLEGHPDNAAPADLGGLTASLKDEKAGWQALKLPLHQCWQLLAVVPNFKLLTAEARSALPSSYSQQDAYFNLARLPYLLQGLAQGDSRLVQLGCQDRLHQPQRSVLIPGFAQVLKAGLQAGASAVFLSGAGPTVAAFLDKRANLSNEVSAAMLAAFAQHQIEAEGKLFEIDHQGLQVVDGA